MIENLTSTSEALYQTLSHDDDLIAVVRGHLYVESMLNRLIESLLPYPKEIENSRLGWPQRVELSLALGLKKQYGAPLKKLGKIRNTFAHQPDASIQQKDILDLYRCLNKSDQAIVLNSYRKACGKHDDLQNKEFGNLDHKSKFALIVISIVAMLNVAISQSETNP